MKAIDIMTEIIFSLSPEDPLRKAAELICKYRIAGLPVVGENQEILGIISEKDILKTIYPSYDEFNKETLLSMDFENMEERYRDSSNLLVKEVMTKNVITASQETPILKLASLMILKKIRRIPIIEDKKLVGIVSQGDVHRAIFKQYFES